MDMFITNQKSLVRWLEYHGLNNFSILDIQQSILDYFGKLDPLALLSFFDSDEEVYLDNPLPSDGLTDVTVDESGVLFVTIIYKLSDFSGLEIPLVVALNGGGKTFLSWDFRKGVSKEDREHFISYLKESE